MAELQKFTEKELQARFDEKNGTWLYNIARGIDLEPVQARFNPKSIGCCKQFRGKAALLDLDNLRKWLKDLGDEIEDRLEKDALENNRTPKQMVVSFSIQMPDGRDSSSSRSYNFVADDELCGELFSNKSLELFMESSEGVKVKDNESNRWLKAPIKFLGISVGKFEDNSESKKSKKILDYFTAGSSKVSVDKFKDSKQKKVKGVERSNKMSKIGKDYIMQKFVLMSEKSQIYKDKLLQTDLIQDKEKLQQTSVTNANESHETSAESQQTVTKQNLNATDHKPDAPILESTLENQESFFAKMLNRNDIHTEDTARPITPLCDVIKCGEDTYDTDYSGSTINDEIDKSMALFEEDPEDVARVTGIRQLLNSSKVMKQDDEECDTTTSEPEQVCKPTPQVIPQKDPLPAIEMFVCNECNKSIPISLVEMHSDYHLALKLRDEERQQVRKGMQDKTIMNPKPEELRKKKQPAEPSDTKNEVVSVARFLVKIDNNVPTETCSECGKKVALDKFGEHLDFHEAQKLSRELNKKISPQFTGSSVKRKRKSASPVKKNKMPCRPITSFFK